MSLLAIMMLHIIIMIITTYQLTWVLQHKGFIHSGTKSTYFSTIALLSEGSLLFLTFEMSQEIH